MDHIPCDSIAHARHRRVRPAPTRIEWRNRRVLMVRHPATYADKWQIQTVGRGAAGEQNMIGHQTIQLPGSKRRRKLPEIHLRLPRQFRKSKAKGSETV